MIFKYSFALCFLGHSLFGALTYQEVLQISLIQSPVIRSSLIELEEREGEKIQSGLYLNPFVSFSVENVLGSKNWKGWESAESRFEFSQPIQIGGQREFSLNMTSYKALAAQFEHSYLELKAANQVKKAFLNVVAAQEMLKVMQGQRQIAEEVQRSILAKAENGKVSPFEINKATLGLANSEIALRKGHTELEVARQKLAQYFGSSCPEFDCLEHPFFQIECPPSFEECMADNEHHPLLIKAQFEQLAACEEAKFECAQNIPNVIVTAGYKAINNTGDKGMILGIAFPLNIFDRNQGNISRTSAQARRVFNDYFEKQLSLETRLLTLHKEGMRAYFELVQLKTVILSIAEESFQLVKEGYEEGKYEYLDLLDAQKVLFESQERYIQALSLFFEKQTDIEYLTL